MVNTRKRNRTIYYICVVALPILQFLIFYVYKNIQMFIYAFQSESVKAGTSSITFAGFDNFKTAFSILGQSGEAIKNSLLLLLFNGVFGLLIALLFAYYIYKNYRLGKFFNLMLFLPNILSTAVFGFIFLNLTDIKVLSKFYAAKSSLLTGNHALVWIILFNIIVNFGVHTLMFLGSMNNINESIVESAELDGANRIQELFLITLPLIYPTFVSFLVISLSGVFTNQMNLYTFYGMSAPITTIGYSLYTNTIRATSGVHVFKYNVYELSAYSIVLTVIVFTITFTARRILNKVGPTD